MYLGRFRRINKVEKGVELMGTLRVLPLFTLLPSTKVSFLKKTLDKV